jgi:hypothetical protein
MILQRYVHAATTWLVYVLFLAILAKYLPGAIVKGQPLPPDYKMRLTYKINGFLSLLVVVTTLCLCFSVNLISPIFIYDYIREFFVVMNGFALILTLLHVGIGYYSKVSEKGREYFQNVIFIFL